MMFIITRDVYIYICVQTTKSTFQHTFAAAQIIRYTTLPLSLTIFLRLLRWVILIYSPEKHVGRFNKRTRRSWWWDHSSAYHLSSPNCMYLSTSHCIHIMCVCMYICHYVYVYLPYISDDYK